MVRDFEAPTGEVTGRIYLVNYSEDLWYSLSCSTQQFCQNTWIKIATPIDGVVRVVLRLLPDELFPMYGHESPYVHWQHTVDRPPECGFTVEARVIVKTLSNSLHLDPIVQADITRALHQYPLGTPYTIMTSEGDTIRHGKR